MHAWTRSFAAIGLGIGLLAGCSSTPAPATVPAQVAADLTGILHTLMQIEPLIVLAAPASFTQAQKLAMQNDLDNAVKVLTRLSAGMPAGSGASVVQEIDVYLNDVVNTLAAVSPLVPILAPWSPIIDALDAVLPTIEVFVNRTLPTPMTTIAGVPKFSLRAARGVRMSPMTADQGRQALGIPVVHP